MPISGISDSSVVQKTCQSYQLDPNHIPNHVAIIMDGNGRWAKQQGLERIKGHEKGVDALRNCLRQAANFGIKYLTAYTFSTENWRRPDEEVKFLMNLLATLFVQELPTLMENGVRVRILGDIQSLPEAVQDGIDLVQSHTEDNTAIQLNLMINYGSRQEITHGILQIAQDYKNGTLSQIDVHTLDNYLYTKDIPEPDLLIRTSGEQRISNFLLWQISYSELWFSPTLWPDFTTADLAKALEVYQKRNRRYGGL